MYSRISIRGCVHRSVGPSPVIFKHEKKAKLSRKLKIKQGRIIWLSISLVYILIWLKTGNGRTNGLTDRPTDGHTLL